MAEFMTYMPAEELYRLAKDAVARMQEAGLACDELKQALAAADQAIRDRDTYASQIDSARQRQTDDLEIDGDPVVSVSDDGVWVSAWVFVPLAEGGDEDEEK